MNPTKVIAEIGENHMGDMSIARQLIADAARAGADYVKFQSYLPATFRRDDPEYDWFCKVSLSDDDHRELEACAKEHGIAFMSSPFSLERARFLCEDMGLTHMKIASGMLMQFDVLDYIDRHAQVVYASTGMATVKEIEQALSHLSHVEHVVLLHCVSQYPCPDGEANLLAMRAMQNAFPNHQIGYSDHTEGIVAALAAVALGASVIEKHVTFDKQAPEGTDHILSATPEELTAMVRDIRRIECMRGHDAKAPTMGEMNIQAFVRDRFVV